MQSTGRGFWSFWIVRWFVLLLCFGGGTRLLRAQAVSLIGVDLSVTPEPSPYEGDFTITYVLNPPPGGPTPTGTVIFTIDTGNFPPVTVAGGIATLPVQMQSYSIGPHTVKAVYSGDSTYLPYTQTINHTIRKLKSDIVQVLLTPQFLYGQTLDAQSSLGAVETAHDASLTNGVLSFYVDNVDVCDLVFMGGNQMCPTSAGLGYDAGTHTLFTTYSGNDYYDFSQSNTDTFTVFPDATSNTLTTSGSPSVFGQAVTFSALIRAPYATPVGPVTFLDGGATMGTATLDATGTANFSTSTLSVGTHTITSTYAGNQNFLASPDATVTQVVVLPQSIPSATVTLLQSSVNPSVFGQNVTFTASAATTGAFIKTPAGTMAFTDGTTLLGSMALDTNGTARLTTSTLAIGQHTIVAAYSPSSTDFTASTSAPLTQVVVTPLTSAGTGFLLTVAPTSLSVGVGSSVSISVSILALNGFDQAVQLSCLNPPYGTACTFDQQTVPVGGGTTRLTVSPAAPHDCGSGVPYFTASRNPVGIPVFAVSVLLLFAQRRRALKSIALAALLATLTALSGCGFGHCTDLGTRPGDYTFTVQASSTGSPVVTHTQVVTMHAHI